MTKSSVRPTGDVEKVLRIHGNLLFRTGLIMLGNAQDAEDAITKGTQVVRGCLSKGVHVNGNKTFSRRSKKDSNAR